MKQETIANLSSLPRDAVFILRDILRGNAYAPQEQALECVATRSHGHVAAIAAMADQLRLAELLDPEPCPERDLVHALVVARVARPLTKLATTRWWQTTTLMDNPVVAAASPEDVYKALDWLIERQGHIERVLARRHLHGGSMVLYDLSSSYVEGTHCALAAFGHNRDRKQGKRQINDGLLTDAEGRPVAIEVFPGNTADPKTVDIQLQKIKDRFPLGRVVLVGDRGMLTSARIEVLRERGGIDWLSALRSKEIQALAGQGLVPLSIFDERDLAEIHSPEFPGERLVVCRNPLLAEERVKHREALMAATEKMLERLSLRVRNGRLKRPEKIAETLGRIKNHDKVAKHFECVIGAGEFRYQRVSVQGEDSVTVGRGGWRSRCGPGRVLIGGQAGGSGVRGGRAPQRGLASRIGSDRGTVGARHTRAGARSQTRRRGLVCTGDRSAWRLRRGDPR